MVLCSSKMLRFKGPMKLGADNDVVVFGSGFMREDDDICYSTPESVLCIVLM
jgi:hypothetical protein